jgi:hypothetical protein
MTIGIIIGVIPDLSIASQIEEELSSYPRISLGCKLSFEFKYEDVP